MRTYTQIMDTDNGDRPTPSLPLPAAEASQLPETPQVWVRQPDEPESAWAAFKEYRDQVPPRRLTAYADVRWTRADVTRWYREWRWQDRVAAFDQFTDGILLAEREAVLKQTAQEIAADHMRMLKDARELASIELSRLLQRAKEGGADGTVKPELVVKMMETVMKFDRLIRGESTENRTVTKTADVSHLTLDELRQMEELARRLEEGKDEPTLQ